MKYLFFPVLFGLGLVGCSQTNGPEVQSDTIQKTADAARREDQTPALRPTVVAATPPSREVIYTGELQLAVDDFDQASAAIDQLLSDHRAYLSTAHETRSDGQHRQEMTVKVPPQEFIPLVAALGKLGRIENKEVNSTDITADVLAAAATLATQQATDARLQQLLANAKSPAEVKLLEQEEQRARADATTAQSALQQLKGRSAWALLTLRYFQVLPASEQESPTLAFGPRFLEAFNSGWSILLGVIVLITYIWPLLVLGAGSWWAVHRWRLRHPTQV